MSREVTCPYCKEDIELDTDDGQHYSEGCEKDQCPKCDKFIMVNSWCTWDSEAEKADCLNGSPHSWSNWSWYYLGESGDNIGKHYERRCCQDCDESVSEWHDEPLDPRGARL